MKLTYNGKVVGIVRDRKLIKTGKQVVLMRSMDGFGIPRELVETAVTARVTLRGNDNTPAMQRKDDHSKPKAVKPSLSTMTFNNVEVHYRGKIYRAPVEKFLTSGIHYYRPSFEPQYILPRKQFTVEDPKQLKLI